VITPLLVELSRRSLTADRGSAFALFSAANATALAIGSIGGAAIVATLGFPAAMVGAFVAITAAAVVAAFDRGLRSVPGGDVEIDPEAAAA
jgi:predicted MFS family arabinose efflux permease